MSQLIDRRRNSGKKNTVNRRRFLRRYSKQLKEAVGDAVSKRSITKIDQGEEITIPAKDISEPMFERSQGGKAERVLPGNDRFISGDHIQRSSNKSGGGSGGSASNQGEGEDDFVFQISREEFLEIFFEDLELPDLVKKDLASISTYKIVRAGVTTSGTPTNMNIRRSMCQAMSRRIALSSGNKRKLAEAEAKLIALQATEHVVPAELLELEEQISLLKKKIARVPYIDTIDLRYNNRYRVLTPTTQAVMFCVMDVSGSMDEPKKEIAKRFFILLYLFLTKNYQKIEIVFIRHHTSAKEVNEQDFFYSRETGGTVVSSALELLLQIIQARYHSPSWNIYVAQASDGDNWNADSPLCLELVRDKIMSLVQYFAYIEIMPRHHQSLWEVYQLIEKKYAHFAMENIDKMADIYPVFHQLFKRKTA